MAYWCVHLNMHISKVGKYIVKFKLYRYLTRTNVSFIDPSPNLVVRGKKGTFLRVT